MDTCDRHGCETTDSLSDLLAVDVGESSMRYVCGQCWFALLEERQKWDNDLTLYEVRKLVVQFLKTPADHDRNTDEALSHVMVGRHKDGSR